MYLDRIDAYDGKLNAVINLNPKALEEAGKLDEELKKTHRINKPLYGIPVVLKDNINAADMPTTAGSKCLENYIPTREAFITKKLKDAGAIILAKVNMHELAVWGETVSGIKGQAYNPYDLTRTPGGSSGGTGGMPHPCWCAGLSFKNFGRDETVFDFQRMVVSRISCSFRLFRDTSGQPARTARGETAGSGLRQYWVRIARTRAGWISGGVHARPRARRRVRSASGSQGRR